ncbi:hypothetical protein QYE76_007289 [Lolium multiflorum]|uniref:GRF-type domain-containing protein n=1 Tax=Lolium multiflorum TaxID=4521 RepID=A0AAD8W456_LOLMU|nr:hypothetical protein QYE76_007289 [Lolium multiflorum]
MANSSSSAALVPHQQQEDIAPLPLIRCPRCNLGVVCWFISHTLKNPGRHFYKCEFHGPNGCGFWKWEDAYIDYLRARTTTPPSMSASNGRTSSLNSSANIPDDPDEDEQHNGPAPTSRTSVPKVYAVISQLSEYKRFLVEEIGFSQLLKLPLLSKLNLRFSKWIMSKIDVTTRSIVIDNKRKIRFWAADVYKVLGIPCGSRDIRAPDAKCSDTTIQMIRALLGMPEKGNHILKFAETVINRDICENTSSTLEKDSFKMAFVIFIMGHLLAPGTKHEYTTIDYWGALANTQQIQDFNWCEYVLLELFAGVQKLKADIQDNSAVTHLQGCHLWAQIFYLDNINLGIFNMRHDSLPRISAYDDVSLRRMINQCAGTAKGPADYGDVQIRDATQICYTRSMWDTPPDRMTPRITTATRQTIPAHTKAKQAASEIGIMMKYHNAICLQQVNALKNSIISDNIRFVDKIASDISESCVCCSIRSLPCIIKKHSRTTEAATTNTHRRRLQMCDSDDILATASTSMRTPAQLKPCTARSPAEMVKTWADIIVGGIMMYNDDTAAPDDAVIMGQASSDIPVLTAQHTYYAQPHWATGASTEYPSIAIQDKLFKILRSLPPGEQNKPCITHETPRYISMPTSSVTDQIVGAGMLEHEMCSIVFRRLRQIDLTVLYKGMTDVFRHYFEPDFSTTILAGDKVVELKSIQAQFCGSEINYNIANCRLFHVPVILEAGWCLYTWDMLKKVINIFDPTTHIPSHPEKKRLHDIVADKIHIALFTCIYKFFKKWHVECNNWKRKFPHFHSTRFTMEESGICITHIARHFNGSSLEEPLSDESIPREKGFQLVQLASIQENAGTIPHEIQKTLASYL